MTHFCTHNETVEGAVLIVINLLLHAGEIHGLLDDVGVVWGKVVVHRPRKELVGVSLLQVTQQLLQETRQWSPFLTCLK